MKEIEFAEKVNTAGGTTYIVGGWVRDELMNQEPKDKDYCVTGFDKTLFLGTFPEAQQVIGQNGKKNVEVFLLDINGNREEIALARKEIKQGEGYHGFKFISNKDITIEDDLYRRDLTINSMAINILTNELIDPYGGKQDIENKVLRATSEAFYEDPLRVYRVAVRHAKTGFEVDDKTKEMMKIASQELHTVKKERVVQELKKSLTSDNPDKFFRLLQEIEVLDIHFGHLDNLYGVIQPVQHHPEGDAFEHTMRVLTAMRKLTSKEERLFSALVHDLGKGITPKELLPKHHGHESAGVPLVKEMCKELGVPKKWEQAALFATENHGKFHSLGNMRDIRIVDLLNEAEKNPLTVEGFADVALSDSRGKENPNEHHPYYTFALEVIREISKVKGNKELEGLKAKEDKRKRQAAIVKSIKKEWFN
ncbi:HD domain-containing protein [Priestia megaterium]|uniref:HD domain-containing protein n=1 Tax=Priestia megaterium TaxID=1404 RepID=UPI002877C4E1|nr:HD domain-containing protein [Priestia megaterium]